MYFKLFRRFSTQQRSVSIKFEDLYSQKTDLFPLIEKAYGSDGLGILVVEDVPGFQEKREKALRLIHQFAHLPEKTLERYESPSTNYSRGWSRGKEIYRNEPDYLKGSFYSTLPPHNNNNILHNDLNIWPDDIIPELKTTLLDTGNQMRTVGLHLLSIIDKFINSHFSSYQLNTSKQQVEVSEMCISRGLYYFPKNGMNNIIKNDDYLWSGWHNDHGSLTALCSAIYLDENGNEGKFKLSKTGLFIKNRKGEDIRVTHRPCDIAFQIGETMQVQSGGILQATPHSVVVGDDIDPNYGRSTFVLFMEPNRDVKLEIPSGVDYLNVKTSEIYDNVPKLQDRYKKDMTFGEFNDITNEYYYSMNKKI